MTFTKNSKNSTQIRWKYYGRLIDLIEGLIFSQLCNSKSINMSAAEPAFKGAGAAPGMELWRIEKMLPVKVTEAPGKFHQGDSYILLCTTASKRYQLSMHCTSLFLLPTYNCCANFLTFWCLLISVVHWLVRSTSGWAVHHLKMSRALQPIRQLNLMRCSVEPQCNTERSRATSHSCSWVTSRYVKSSKNNFSLQHYSLDCNLIPLLCNILSLEHWWHPIRAWRRGLWIPSRC